MADRRSFLRRSLGAATAVAVRWALPVAALGTRILPPLLRYAGPPYWRFNLLRNFFR